MTIHNRTALSPWLLACACAGLALVAVAGGDEPQRPAAKPETNWKYPLIQQAGGIQPLPQATQPPHADTSVVFDITKLDDPQKMVAGIDRMARLLNLYAEGNVDVRKSRFALVLHGDATVAALSDSAYARHTGCDKNPNRLLLAELRKLGVEVYVCGQALAHKKFPHDEVTEEVAVALSAMNVLINTQNKGYAYLPFH